MNTQKKLSDYQFTLPLLSLFAFIIPSTSVASMMPLCDSPPCGDPALDGILGIFMLVTFLIFLGFKRASIFLFVWLGPALLAYWSGERTLAFILGTVGLYTSFFISAWLCDLLNLNIGSDSSAEAATSQSEKLSIGDKVNAFIKIEEQHKQAQENAKLAKANQQQRQAQQKQKQQQQQSVDTAKALSTFGFQPTLDPQTQQPTGHFTLGEKQFFEEQSAVKFAKELATAGKALTPTQQSLVAAVIGSRVCPIKQANRAKTVVKKATLFLDNIHIISSVTPDEAVARIDYIIARLAPKTNLISGKPTDNAKTIGYLDNLREKLAGQRSTVLEQIVDAQLQELKLKKSRRHLTKVNLEKKEN